MNESIRVLVVDDEDSVRKRCVRLLARHGYEVVGARDSQAALNIVQTTSCDVMLVDIRMPGIDGLELLKRVKAYSSSIEVIMMTGYAAVETAVKAMKYGAYDYLAKPFEPEELLHVIQNVAEKKCLQREVKELRGQLRDHQESPLVGNSEAMATILRFIDKVAPVDCNILLQGESGTGKELVAKRIHASSPRSQFPFVVADCAALSGALLDSELFGHVKGAFTGAYATRRGYFESADRGTIFLDEIAELPLDLQGKLLRAVEENVVFRLGSSDPVKADVRIIAATNKNLEHYVSRGLFRHDLFYRLNVVGLTIPPLRERSEDIPLLIKYFSGRSAALLGLSKLPRMRAEVQDALMAYDWPGNVRELQNAVYRALVLVEDEQLSVHHMLPISARGCASPTVSAPTGDKNFKSLRRQVAQDFTKDYLESCLRRNGGNVTLAAEVLGMRRTSLQRLLKRAGLDAGKFRGQVPPK
ncbi:MAG: sigma-54 dependent transcriptional regulator [Desulfomonilaceae bacterium]